MAGGRLRPRAAPALGFMSWGRSSRVVVPGEETTSNPGRRTYRRTRPSLPAVRRRVEGGQFTVYFLHSLTGQGRRAGRADGGQTAQRFPPTAWGRGADIPYPSHTYTQARRARGTGLSPSDSISAGGGRPPPPQPAAGSGAAWRLRPCRIPFPCCRAQARCAVRGACRSRHGPNSPRCTLRATGHATWAHGGMAAGPGRPAGAGGG